MVLGAVSLEVEKVNAVPDEMSWWALRLQVDGERNIHSAAVVEFVQFESLRHCEIKLHLQCTRLPLPPNIGA